MWTMFDGFTAYQITILVISAALIGINKTALPGIGILPVVLLAMSFESRMSTGLQLGMLAMTDILAVIYYRRHADWKILLRLLPSGVAGLALGSLILWGMQALPGCLEEGSAMHRILSDEDLVMRRLIGFLVLLMLVGNFLRARIAPDRIPSGPLASAGYGVALGVCTQLANAAGPVSAIYLLAMKLPKNAYMGCTAWLFLILNWIKLPLFVFEGRITMQSIQLDLMMLPVLIVFGIIGVHLLKKLSQKLFNGIVEILALAATIKLLFF